MARRRQRQKHYGEMTLALVFVTFIIAASVIAGFSPEKNARIVSLPAKPPTGFAVVPAPSGGTAAVERIDEKNYGHHIIPANADYLLELETSAADGEYLAYGIDGEYRADVLASGGRITLLLNLARDSYELRVYVPKGSIMIVEKHSVIAI